MKKKKRTKRMEATFISNEFEGIFLIITIGSLFLAGLGFWTVIEVLTGSKPLDELVSGLGLCIFFSLTARYTSRRL
jgi:hypothetical protein